VIAVKFSKFSSQYFGNHWTLDIGVLGYIVIVCPKEHSSEVRTFPPGTPCICIYVFMYICIYLGIPYLNKCRHYIWKKVNFFMFMCLYTNVYMYVFVYVSTYVCI